MSKSKGNVVAPWDVLDAHGADAFRWYYFTSKQPWDGYRFSLDDGRRERAPVHAAALEHVRLLTSVRERRTTSTGADADRSAAPTLDRWVLSRLHATTETVIERLDDYDTTTAGPRDRGVRRRAVELVRPPVAAPLLGRRPGGVLDAARRACVTVSKLLAPLTPFVADAIYENLDGSEPSVHLCDFPERRRARRRARGRDGDRARRRSSSAAPRARTAKMKVRQPLAEAVVVAADRERERDRALRGSRPRGAERQADPLRRTRPRSSAAGS